MELRKCVEDSENNWFVHPDRVVLVLLVIVARLSSTGAQLFTGSEAEREEPSHAGGGILVSSLAACFGRHDEAGHGNAPRGI